MVVVLGVLLVVAAIIALGMVGGHMVAATTAVVVEIGR